MTEDPDSSLKAPVSAPAVRRILDAFEEIAQEREREAAGAAAKAARAEAAPAVPARQPPRHAWNDLWTIDRPPPGPVADTETLLNGLIDECGFLMREVGFRLLRTAPDVDMIGHHLRQSMELADTGARVALAIAKLRRSAVGESRQSITLERIERLAEIEKPSIRANNDQAVAS